MTSGFCAVYHDTMFGVVSTSSVYRTGDVSYTTRTVTPLGFRNVWIVWAGNALRLLRFSAPDLVQ